jgi:hypothetical protein
VFFGLGESTKQTLHATDTESANSRPQGRPPLKLSVAYQHADPPYDRKEAFWTTGEGQTEALGLRSATTPDAIERWKAKNGE